MFDIVPQSVIVTRAKRHFRDGFDDTIRYITSITLYGPTLRHKVTRFVAHEATQIEFILCEFPEPQSQNNAANNQRSFRLSGQRYSRTT